ncbi:MAG: signal peptidase II [Candidatus Puniceispirillales bacterium]
MIGKGFPVKLFIPVVAVAILDALTKKIALATVFDPPRIIEVLPFVNIVPVWNDGISFGFLQNGGELSRYLLALVAFAVALGLPLYARRWGNYACFGGLMMAGGAAGNGIDRVIYGRVVDFIDLHAGQWHWPAFNLADMAITTGAGLIIVASLWEARAKEE